MKRLVWLFIVFFTCVVNFKNVSAEETNSIEDYVTEFAGMVTNSETIKVKNITMVYEKGLEYGYYFEFEDCGEYIGYVLYCINSNDIDEYSFEGEKNAELEVQQKKEAINRQNFLEYEVVNAQPLVASSTSSYDSVFDMITDKPSVAGNSKYSYYRCKYLKSRSMYCEDDLPKWGLADTQSQSWFACAVMAMLNVCKQSSFFDVNSVKDLSRAYCNLYSMANTDDNGYTREDILGDTIQRFAKASKNIDVSYTYKENPSTSYFVSAINNDYSAILGLVGKEGHAVSVNGYVQYKNISTGSVKTYLCVADGWYEKTRYICLSTIKARSTSGTVIKYKIK